MGDSETKLASELDTVWATQTDLARLEKKLDTIIEHMAGIEEAFRVIAESTNQAMGFLDDSVIGKMLGKVMGRNSGDGEPDSSS